MELHEAFFVISVLETFGKCHKAAPVMLSLFFLHKLKYFLSQSFCLLTQTLLTRVLTYFSSNIYPPEFYLFWVDAVLVHCFILV